MTHARPLLKVGVTVYIEVHLYDRKAIENLQRSSTNYPLEGIAKVRY